ncbi:mitochondrial carrier [Boletus edulis]|nr:mitochondrial carrier [Boletus edulis]
MLNLTDMLLLVGSLAISLAILVPLTGALVRFRAHYNPKGLQLDPEGGVQPHTGPVITSFIAMLVRVYRIEGWPGLYKGLMPILLSTAIVTLFLWLFSNLRHEAYTFPSTDVLGTLPYSLFAMLISLPETIVIDRAITTPNKLPYFNAISSLRILLTPTERRRPWILYLTPGLFAAQVLRIAYVLGLRTVRQLLLPELPQPGFPSEEDVVSAIKLDILFVLVLVSPVVLTPLEVIATRLAIQRNHAAPGFNSVAQEEEGDAEEATEYAGMNEDVIGLRSEREPYIGLVDCGKRIVDEEGWSALYRVWWLTMLGCLAGAFS